MLCSILSQNRTEWIVSSQETKRILRKTVYLVTPLRNLLKNSELDSSTESCSIPHTSHSLQIKQPDSK